MDINNLVLICWGRFITNSSPSPTQSLSVVLPISYQTDKYNIQITKIVGNAGDGNFTNLQAGSTTMDGGKTLSQFETFNYYHQNWLTIGY